MQKFVLNTYSPFINPFWYNSSKGKSFETVVIDNKIVINNEKLVFFDQNVSFPDNTEVIVFINNNFYCYLKSEYNQHLIEIEEKRKIEELKEKEILNNKRTEAEEFYKNLNLPFKFDVGHKDNLSGLTVNSWGDGRKRNTVEHIIILEDVSLGKIKRKSNDFLCTSKSGTNGKRWVQDNISRYCDGNHNEYMPKITCKSCLKLLEKYGK